MKPSVSSDEGRSRDERYSLARWRPVAVDDLVRVGRAHDGGYVISSRCVSATRVLVGMGINDDWSFEQDFVRRNPAVRVIGIDGSVSYAAFHERAQKASMLAFGYFLRCKRWLMTEQRREAAHWRDFNAFFGSGNRTFHEKFLSDVDDDPYITWATLCELEPELGREHADSAIFIKLDIERGEYRVLADLLKQAARITGLAIEFHDCDLLWDRFADLMTQLQDRFAIVHLHGNNFTPLIPGTSCPQTLEVSLVNKALMPPSPSPSVHAYPIPGLDMPNNRERDDYRLVF